MRFNDDRFADIVGPGEAFFAREMALPQIIRRGLPIDDTYTRRDYCDAMIYLRGEGTHLVVNRHGRLQADPVGPGRVFVWRPQDRRAAIPDYGPGGAVIIQVGFPATQWRAFAGLMGIEPDRLTAADRLVGDIPVGDEAAVAAFRRALRAVETGATPFELARFWSEIGPLLFGSSTAHGARPGAPAWLVDGVEAMRDEENMRLGLARLRELTHVSTRHLSRSTQRYYGMSPLRLLAELRLRQATRLLGSTFDSVSSIAARCGYASPKYLSDRFHRAMGVSPREYRARSLAGFSPPR